MHGLGRLPSPPDARDYRMSDAVRELEKVSAPRPVKRWKSSKVLDQGETPHCVGFAWAGWGISAPIEDPWCDLTGHDIYKACKVLDGEPDMQNGSTVRTGAKVLIARKRIKTYFFAQDVDEALDFVARFGPVVFGTIWTEGMSKPSSVGHVIRVIGKVLGGHAYDVVGVDSKYALIKQSWGTGWLHSDSGYARILITDLKAAFRESGEACAATEQLLPVGGV